MNCPVCYKNNEVAFNKKGYDYHFCFYCYTCYCKEIDQSNMVGGGFEYERNTIQNQERINRIKSLSPIPGIKHLDWGCGHGMLVNDCISAGINSEGYDKFNPDYYREKHPYQKYDIVSLVEVIEHMSEDSLKDLMLINLCLKPGGIVYIETCFTNLFFREEDGVLKSDLPNEYYIDPSVGHCTIFSHTSLDIRMIRSGFRVLSPVNQNVRLYQKP